MLMPLGSVYNEKNTRDHTLVMGHTNRLKLINILLFNTDSGGG